MKCTALAGRGEKENSPRACWKVQTDYWTIFLLRWVVSEREWAPDMSYDMSMLEMVRKKPGLMGSKPSLPPLHFLAVVNVGK